MKPVGFDNTFLSILLNPNGQIPLDPQTGQPVVMARQRAESVVEALGKSRQKIVLPTPAIAELLTAIGPDAQQYVSIIGRSRLFELASFDPRCAIELACLNRDVFSIHDPKTGAEPYQKVKIDRQIIAILKVAGVETVYTDDEGFAKRARLCGMIPVSTAELPLPSENRQRKLAFDAPDEIPEPEPQAEVEPPTTDDPEA
jgi:predicted nucleic acid-binding protein